ncbi:DJ-1/PfpI family protein [Endozoicomonas gorgoniicola]|uniref:DJ-1/PfpI family protein n=1 Tax=Endozoicomonas gorgoniicola TaxID=1234144 RepID=A0ABT3MRE7_9GAMM|nr:DJ-1 family glyoxalase III [Endozoicomonas gorgoniicola]MCW7551922.1 DJ-1/PfpI family protein [Endozoicomonas gorgoniicola]
MSRPVLVPIAQGCEEIEAVTIIDTLRRAGAKVTVAACTSDDSLDIEASRGVKLTADTHINHCRDKTFHMIALPGGMPGAANLRDSEPLIQLLHEQKQASRWYTAICAAPAVVLAHHSLLDNVSATCYPSFLDQLEGALPRPTDPVVIDLKNKVITAQGPGNAMSFSFALIDALYGKDTHRPVAKQMIADWAIH